MRIVDIAEVMGWSTNEVLQICDVLEIRAQSGVDEVSYDDAQRIMSRARVATSAAITLPGPMPPTDWTVPSDITRKGRSPFTPVGRARSRRARMAGKARWTLGRLVDRRRRGWRPWRRVA
jgi:hypothetical protein